MRRVILFLSFIFLSHSCIAQNYVFFLHNAFLEGNTTDAIHLSYGKYEYPEILDAFRKAGLKVISEIRPANSDVAEYAQKIVRQIDSLRKKGIPASHITVIGASKGGGIAMQVSTLLKENDVNFVFIACCSESSSDGIRFHGNILSIYEKSDQMGSCEHLKKLSPNGIPHFKEIALSTGLGHGFQFKALSDWLAPCVSWAQQNY